VGQFEADERMAREQSRMAMSLDSTLQQAGIDNSMDLPQRHASDRGRLICGHETAPPIRCHSRLQNHSTHLETIYLARTGISRGLVGHSQHHR
jgi:hypothetical protein